MSDCSAILAYEKISEVEEPVGKRPLLMCPTDQCQDMGTYENLCGHWARIHQAYILLYLCPFQGCGCKKMMAGDIREHAEEEHGLKGESLTAFDSVPAVVQVVPNHNFKFPGDHSPLTNSPRITRGNIPLQG